MADQGNPAMTPGMESNPITTPVAEPTTPPAQPPAQPTVPPIPPEDVQGMVTRESRRAVEKLLKDAGITPGDNPEMQLRDYKKWLDSQKTELQLAQGSVQTVTQERDAAFAELTGLKNTLLAVQKGVPAGKAPMYIKLTEHYTAQGMAFDAALDAAMKDFPVATPTQQGPRYAGPSGKVEQPPAKDFKEMSYGERLALKQSNPALYAQMKGAT